MSGLNGQFNARLQRLEKKAAEGGGGGEAFVIHKVPGTIVGDTPHLDKSYNEIVAAITNGQPIQVILSTMQGDYLGYIFYFLLGVSQEGAQSFVAHIYNIIASEEETYLSETADGQLVRGDVG